MYYNGLLITTQYGEWAATYDGQLVATAPSKDELFRLLDGIVDRYRRNRN